jgi:hypothetical protein
MMKTTAGTGERERDEGWYAVISLFTKINKSTVISAFIRKWKSQGGYLLKI